MGKGPCPPSLMWPVMQFLHSHINGWASGCGGSPGLLGIYCKEKRWCPLSVCCGGLAGIKLSFIFSAPVHHDLKKRLLPSPRLRDPLLEVGALCHHISILQLAITGKLQHGFWINRSEHVNSQRWISPQNKAPLMPGRAVMAISSQAPCPDSQGQQCSKINGHDTC